MAEPLSPKEALYVEDNFYYLSQSSILSREKGVFLDYLFESAIPESQEEVKELVFDLDSADLINMLLGES